MRPVLRNFGEITVYLYMLVFGGGEAHWIWMHLNRFDYYVMRPEDRTPQHMNALAIYN